MSIPAEYTASISTIPYRYDPGVRGDCGISYFVDNQLHQSRLSIQDGGTANHQGLGAIQLGIRLLITLNQRYLAMQGWQPDIESSASPLSCQSPPCDSSATFNTPTDSDPNAF